MKRWTPCLRRLRLVLVICLLPIAGCSAGAPSPVQVLVTEEVLLAEPTRLGVNIGASNYWGDEQYVSNPFGHGAFPRGRQVMMLPVRESTENTVTDAYFDADDPDRRYVDSFEGGSYCIATGTRAGETGSIEAHTAGTGTFTLSRSGEALAPGDLVWLKGPLTRRAQPDPADEELESTIGIGDFRPITDDGVSLEFEDGGTADTQVLALSFPPESGRLQGGVKHYVRAMPDREYTVVVRARADTPGAMLGVEMECYGLDASEPGYRPALTSDRSAVLTDEWADYRFTLATSPDPRVGTRNSVVKVVISLDSKPDAVARAWIDSVAWDDPAMQSESAFTREVVDALKEARCGVLRFYGVASLGSLVESITAADAQHAPWSYWSLASRGRFNQTDATVDDWMQLCESVGATPWITVGSPNMPGDWYDLISYLCAPNEFDTASARRGANGRTEPWIGEDDTVYLEIGNEWWNPIFRPFYAGPPEKYGELCNTIIKRVREHPHFDPARVKIVLGGWAINAHHWNGVVDGIANHHDFISIAPYLLHELDDATSISDRYGTLFADIDAYRAGGGASTLADLKENGKDTGIAVYELNTHTTGGAAAESVSEMAPSLAAGVAVLDHAIGLMATMKADPINYFTLLQRDYDGRLGLWGNLVRPPDGGLRPRPVWQGLRMANQYLIEGDLVVTMVSGSPGWRQPKNGSVPAIDSVSGLHAYSFVHGEPGIRKANVLLVNRMVTQEIQAEITLPFAAKPEAVQVTLSGDTPSLNNEDALHVSLKEKRVTFLGDNPTLQVPAFSALVVQFEEE